MRNTQIILLFAVTLMLSVWLLPTVVLAQTESAKTPDGPEAIETYRRAVLAESGDAARGQTLFDNAQKTRCKLCHAIEGRGNQLGPDLLGVGGRYDREGLLESILNPSAKIHPDYVGTIVVTKAGKTFTGILRPISDNEIEIATNETDKVRVQVSDIEERKASPTSTMPSGLHEKITPSEMASLLAYLAGLRSTTPGTLQDARDLSEISRAARPVDFVPIIPADAPLRLPVWFGFLPGTSNINVVLELDRGRVWLLEGEAGELRKSLFVDVSAEITATESRGITSIAFHPDFVRNRRYFVKLQSRRTERNFSVNVIERKATFDGLRDSGEPSKLMLKIPVFSEVHIGGDLKFGPDGYLYLGMGDSGPQKDPNGHGQNLALLWGKILRIDVDHTQGELPYAIPADNPFRSHSGARPEIWALGFREPWRIHFDSKTGDLWVGDVGQNLYEEITIVRKGENHGWNIFEGFQPHSDQYASKEATYVPPVFAYSHAIGPSVTGGFVYRGSKYPFLVGKYIFGDYETRYVWALEQKDRKIRSIIQVGRAPGRIASFGVDAKGELYAVAIDLGMIYRLDFDKADLTPTAAPTEIVPTSRQASFAWRYTLQQPTAAWTNMQFEDSSWGSSHGGFGTKSTPRSVIGTDWSSADIWLRRVFTLEQFRADRIALVAHHVGDAEFYLNGILAAKLPGSIRDYEELPISEDARATLKPGRNILAVHCHQPAGNSQYIDAGLIEFRLR